MESAFLVAYQASLSMYIDRIYNQYDMFDTHTYACICIVVIYHIAQNFGGGKFWRIWRISQNFPTKFLQTYSLQITLHPFIIYG